jgi:DNA-binding LacI/PurR family transcriptional regulator
MNIQDVAKRAKVSVATVSRTLHHDPRVRPETAERVWEVIRELNYVPNSYARSLSMGRSQIVGLIVSDITNPFFPELVKGFEEVAIEHGYDVIAASTGYDPARTATCVQRMVERQVDGVAVMTSEFERSIYDQFISRDVPLVFLDVGQLAPGVSNVRVDYAHGLSQAVRHLRDLGHQRIAFISGPLGLESARVRHRDFLRALEQVELPACPDYVVEGDHRVDGGLHAMQRLLQLPGGPPTAVIGSNDLTAIGAIRAIRRAGIQVPEEISVIGHDDIELAGYIEPPLTTVRLSRTSVARAAFAALHTNLREKGAMGVELPVATELVLRESTAAAPATLPVPH